MICWDPCVCYSFLGSSVWKSQMPTFSLWCFLEFLWLSRFSFFLVKQNTPNTAGKSFFFPGCLDFSKQKMPSTGEYHYLILLYALVEVIRYLHGWLPRSYLSTRFWKTSTANESHVSTKPPQRMAQAVESTGRVTVPHRLVAKSGSYVAAIGHCGQRSEWRSLGLRILWIDMSNEKRAPVVQIGDDILPSYVGIL